LHTIDLFFFFPCVVIMNKQSSMDTTKLNLSESESDGDIDPTLPTPPTAVVAPTTPVFAPVAPSSELETIAPKEGPAAVPAAAPATAPAAAVHIPTTSELVSELKAPKRKLVMNTGLSESKPWKVMFSRGLASFMLTLLVHRGTKEPFVVVVPATAERKVKDGQSIPHAVSIAKVAFDTPTPTATQIKLASQGVVVWEDRVVVLVDRFDPLLKGEDYSFESSEMVRSPTSDPEIGLAVPEVLLLMKKDFDVLKLRLIALFGIMAPIAVGAYYLFKKFRKLRKNAAQDLIVGEEDSH
jgi:hypothetical protein